MNKAIRSFLHGRPVLRPVGSGKHPKPAGSSLCKEDMHAFNDNQGRTWNIAVNAATIRLVRAYYPWFLQGGAVETFDRLAECGSNLAAAEDLINVLYLLCRDQANAASISDGEFGRALCPDVLGNPIEHATAAMIEACLEFLPAGEAIVLRAARAKNLQVRETARQRALARLDPVTRERLQQEL
jgi:hypothetical protein